MAQKPAVGMAVAKFDYKASDLHELNINKGEKLTLLDDSQHWWQVMNCKGETGYVPSNYCKKSKQGLFSSLKNTLGRKKNKESPNPGSCGASSVGTAPSGSGRRSVTSSPKTVNPNNITSSEIVNKENTNDHNKLKSYENNASHTNNANPFYSMGSLKSNGSNNKVLNQKPSQSMSYNAGQNISIISSDKHNQSQPTLPAQLPHYPMQKVPSSESQFHSSAASHVSSNQQFNGREYFGSGGSKSKMPSNDVIGELCVERFRQDSRLVSGGEVGMIFQNSTGSLGPVSVCVAKFSYSPCQPDELALSRGDRIKVLEKSSDGWWRGELINNNSMVLTGWFPSNYVTLERPQHNNYRSTTDSLGRQPQGSGLPVSSQLHSSMPSVTSGIDSTCIINNHHGDGMDKWSGLNKLHSLQRYSTVLTLYPFLKNQPEEMSFDANEILDVIDRPVDDPDWWRCKNQRGEMGLVPRNYVKQLTSTGALLSKQPFSAMLDQKQCTTVNSDSGETIRLSYNRTGRFKDRIWYWGAISRIECESLLMMSGYLGQFVVRDSESHPGDLTITMHAGTKCRNFKVHLQNSEYHIGQKVFSNVESLIQHYRSHPIYKSDSERLFLTDPFQYKTPLSSF